MTHEAKFASVVFAAGSGKRLRPLTERLAKPALPILDVPMGAWALAAALRCAPPVVVNLSHLASTVPPALKDALPHGRWEAFVEEPEGFGTAGTLRALSSQLADPVLTYNADLLSDLDPIALLDAHARLGAGATLAARAVAEWADLELDGDRVVSMIDRRAGSRPGWQFVGAAAFSQRALELLPETRPAGLGETLLPALADRGDLAVHRFDGYALDVGRPDRYLRANLDLLDGKAPPSPSPPSGEIVDVLGGRAYVGPGAQVQESSLGSGAIVMSGARVDPSARVERAIVWPRELVPAGARLRDAIWAFDRPIGAT